ncbi:class I SAM-dependent methyltransferase [Agromyces bauzanensis]
MTDTAVPTATEADRALKAKHRAMWASGDYPTLASELIWELGPRLVAATDVRPGERVLDIAAGSGNVAIPAALRGATVVASDLTPELFEVGRRLAAEAGAELEWREADAEALPFADGSFDVTLTSVGIMFAPHHQQAADELVRVTASGGRLGLISWTPEGFIGQMFKIMKPFAAPLPEGAQPAPLWGDEQHVRELLGDRVTDVTTERQTVDIRFDTGEAFRDYFKRNYGPTIAVYNRIADDHDQVAALDAALAALGDNALDASGVMQWEYLLFTARVR